MKTITLTLTIEEVNQLLDALSQQPYNTVYQLIGKLQQQARNQLTPKEEPASKEKVQKAKINKAT